jgi:hypothetical protein
VNVEPATYSAVSALANHPDPAVAASSAWWCELVTLAQSGNAPLSIDPQAFTTFFEQAHLYADAPVRSAFLGGMPAVIQAMARAHNLPAPVGPPQLWGRPPGGAAQGYWG